MENNRRDMKEHVTDLEWYFRRTQITVIRCNAITKISGQRDDTGLWLSVACENEKWRMGVIVKLDSTHFRSTSYCPSTHA